MEESNESEGSNSVNTSTAGPITVEDESTMDKLKEAAEENTGELLMGGSLMKGSHVAEEKGSYDNDTAEVTSLNHLWTGLAAEDDTTAGATMMMKGMGDSMGPDTRTMGVTTMSTNDTMHLVGKTPLFDARKKKERRRSLSTPDMLQGLWRESESDDDSGGDEQLSSSSPSLMNLGSTANLQSTPSPSAISALLHTDVKTRDLQGSEDTTGDLLLPSEHSMSPPKQIKLLKSSMKSAFKKSEKKLKISPRVKFGSPGVAEFNRDTPPISMRKLSRGDSKSLFPLDGNPSMMGDDEEDDPETLANSSVLEEAGDFSSEEDSDGSDEGGREMSRRSSFSSRRASIGIRRSSVFGDRRGTIVGESNMSMSSVGESMDEEISFNHAPKPLEVHDSGEDAAVSFNNIAGSVQISMDASIGSTDTEEDASVNNDGHTAIVNADMSFESSVDASRSLKRHASPSIADSPSSEYIGSPLNKKPKQKTPPSRRLSNVFEAVGKDNTVPLESLATLVQQLDGEPRAVELSHEEEDQTIALESLGDLLRKQDTLDVSNEEDSKVLQADQTVELENGLLALLHRQLDSDDDDSVHSGDIKQRNIRRGSIVVNEPMDLTEDFGVIVQSEFHRVNTADVTKALGLEAFFTPVSFQPPPNTMLKELPSGMATYASEHSTELASKSLHLLATVPDVAIHQWAISEMKAIILEASTGLQEEIKKLDDLQPAIYRHIGGLVGADTKVDEDTCIKAKMCAEINRLAAAKEWIRWNSQIKTRLCNDFLELQEKLNEDLKHLNAEMERAKSIEFSLEHELVSLSKLISLQDNVQGQEDVLAMFQSRVHTLKQNVLRTQETIASLKAQRKQMTLRIEEQDDLIECRERLSNEVRAVQSVFELTSQLSGWKCREMLSHSIQFERLHGNGMRHTLSVNTKLINGSSVISSDIWLVDERAFDEKSIFHELLAAQDVACDSTVRHIGSIKDLRDAMLALDVMFGRCRLLANEFEHVCDSFICENVLYGRGSHLSFTICLTSTHPEPTKWTADVAVGFGYPAGEMTVNIKSAFGVSVGEFNLRAVGKGFNRLLRACQAIQSLFYETLG
jgi:hypothetical protein